MRSSSLLFLLPALGVVAEQKPMEWTESVKAWFNKASEAAAKNVKNVPNIIPDSLDSGAAKVAEVVVEPINASNWKDVLVPGASKSNEWLVYVTGSNKTCYGNCVNATKAWNV
jgi:hypothetical protein